MQRIIIFVAVLYVLWRVLAAMGRRSAASGRGAEDFSRFNVRSKDRREAARARHEEDVELIPCAHCQTLVPADRALSLPSGVTCCSRRCADALEADLDPSKP